MQSFVWSKLLLALNQKEDQLGLRSIVFDFEGMGLVLFDCVIVIQYADFFIYILASLA